MAWIKKIKIRFPKFRCFKNEFDVQEENKMRNPLEGLLFKYTNVVKGWQFRWFVLNPETGYLEYYMVSIYYNYKS
ncbi:oxysterol-binding protein-related protein 11-like isoform X3 [Centruroides sculpturatus]|uniref:oxysterol-binding protein-related protein 11-like isoform X3 n=1 Tax=Centruroides sculpturatus TaxID=218467 RepID=UPI000C6E8845|nr:oxysterol-binding protein-related protein 11-like isoform X3 [Centruroides sculpturatus]